MKRFFDLVFSLVVLLLVWPLLALLALVVFLDDGGPVIYRQDRVGKDGKLFKIRKFRTMKHGTRAAAKSDLREFEDCVTRTGRFLRRTSLDELPQILNILDGSMSVIGPRPLIPEEDLIHRLRNEYGVYAIRPGVTGLAQISGRDTVSPEEKARYDKEYLDTRSLWLDIKILVRTVFAVLKAEDVLEGEQKNEEDAESVDS